MKDGVPERKHPRLKQYDYSQDGVYFVTVCTNGKKRILSRIVGRPAPWPPEVRLTPIGKIVEQTLKNTANVYPGVSIDHYVIMPNHIHFLLRIDGGGQRAGRPTLMTMIHGFKNVVTRKIGQKIWQNSFYEHVVRDEIAYQEIWHYIDTNPAKWAQDALYVTDFPDPVRRPACCTNKEVTQMSRYFTKTLAALEPYTPGEQLKLPDLVKLNANENPYPPAPGVAAAVAGAVPGLRLYSDLTEAALCAAIARHCGVQPENILCGNGSDENLLLALRAFCDETHPLAFADITYSFYPVLCDLLHIPQHVIPVEEDFSLDLSKYHGLNETIVIANPNAPTTLLQPVAAIEEVVRTNPDSIVIVDEAYIDFAGPDASCVPLTKKYDNVIVVQTFSKSHNLAGARVGFCVANPELIADMNRIKFSYSPYNVNSLSQAAAVAAMEDEDYFRDTVDKICATRADTMTKLRERGFTGPDSATNFLFVTTSRMPCKQIFERLRQKGVLIRYFSAPRLSDYLRITIGTPEQMQRFFEELDLILG